MAEPEVVTALLEAAPGAVDAADARGWTPLHLAARHRALAEVVDALLTAGADATAETADGYTPLLLALRAGADTDAVLLLVPPGGLSEEAAAAALHASLEGGAAEAVVQRLLGTSLARLRAPDSGETALHVAVRCGAPLRVLQAVVAAFPDAVSAADAGLQTPLHVAAARSAPPEVLDALLGVCPESAVLRDGDGMLPCERAEYARATLAVVERLRAAAAAGGP